MEVCIWKMEMASLCTATTLPLHSPSTNHRFSPFSASFKPKSRFPLTSRFKNVMKLQIEERLFVVSASNSNPSGGESGKDKSLEISNDGAKGPPFLTILAGFLIFFGIIWVFKSILMCLFGLIIPASK